MTSPTLVVSNDPAREAAVRVRAALVAHGPRLAISGGSALRVVARLFERAATDDAVTIEPRELVLTWVDERVVPRASSESNAGEAERLVALPHHVPLLRDDELEAPSRAIARVEAAIDEVLRGALDVTLLGLGEDGHVASLFPHAEEATSGHAWDRPGARVMLVERSPKPPPRRLTLARSFLATAKAHVVFAVGAGKRDAIARLRGGDPALPATGLAGVVVVTDAAGAGV